MEPFSWSISVQAHTVFAFYAGYLSPFFYVTALDKEPAKQQTLLARLGTVAVMARRPRITS